MKATHRFGQIAATLAASLTITCAHAQTPNSAATISQSIITPDKVETRIGALEFKDGAPSKATLDKVYDNLGFTHAFEAFVNTFQGVNMAAIRKSLHDTGVKDNEFVLFALLDAKSLLLTANARLHVLRHRIKPRVNCFAMAFDQLDKGTQILGRFLLDHLIAAMRIPGAPFLSRRNEIAKVEGHVVNHDGRFPLSTLFGHEIARSTQF